MCEIETHDKFNFHVPEKDGIKKIEKKILPGFKLKKLIQLGEQKKRGVKTEKNLTLRSTIGAWCKN